MDFHPFQVENRSPQWRTIHCVLQERCPVTLDQAITYYLAKGQQDYVDGFFAPPMANIDPEIATILDHASQNAYLAGWKKAKDAADRSGISEPPPPEP